VGVADSLTFVAGLRTSAIVVSAAGRRLIAGILLPGAEGVTATLGGGGAAGIGSALTGVANDEEAPAVNEEVDRAGGGTAGRVAKRSDIASRAGKPGRSNVDRDGGASATEPTVSATLAPRRPSDPHPKGMIVAADRLNNQTAFRINHASPIGLEGGESGSCVYG
jgi:hypothetical protein